MPDGGEEVVAAVLADDVVLAETASPDGARWRTASPFWKCDLETEHWLMMAARQEDIQEGYKLKLQTLGESRA